MKKGINNTNKKGNKSNNNKMKKAMGGMNLNSLNDPMNSLENTVLKEKRINMISNFLILNNYPNNFNKKDFSSMSIDFRPILKFIMEKIDPNVNLLESLTDDKIESLAKIYDYPGKLTRSMIRDFNTPSNFLYILTFVCYMANLASFKEYFIENELDNIYYNNNSNDQELNIFLNECAENSNDLNSVYNRYKKKFNMICKEELNKVDQLFLEVEKLEKYNSELKTKVPNVDLIKNEKVEAENKFNEINKEYKQINNDIKTYSNTINELNKGINEEENKISNLEIEITNIQNQINSQVMTRAEYDIKIEENNTLMDKINNIKKDIEIYEKKKIDLNNTNQVLVDNINKTCDEISSINISKNIPQELLDSTNIFNQIKENISKKNHVANETLYKKYEEYIKKYNNYIDSLKNDYEKSLNEYNELEKNKNAIFTKIDKFNNLIINNNKVYCEKQEKIINLNNEYNKFKNEGEKKLNVIKNEIKILEKNIEEKKKKSIITTQNLIKEKKEFDEYKENTNNLINNLINRLDYMENDFIETNSEILSKIILFNQKLNNICEQIPDSVNLVKNSNENKKEDNKENNNEEKNQIK